MPKEAVDKFDSASIQRLTGLVAVRVFARLSSTQARAAALLDAGALALPGVVVASRQTAGRGRGGHAWWSDAGTLTATFASPIAPGRSPQELPLRAGLAVCQVVGSYVDADRVRVKWPNDVLVDGRKIAGLLCARHQQADLVGIGLNVATDFSHAPAEVRGRATSIRQAGGAVPRRSEVLVLLARTILELWRDGRWHERFNLVDALAGEPVAVDTGAGVVRGDCLGVDEQGRLLVHDGRRLHKLLDGTIVS